MANEPTPHKFVAVLNKKIEPGKLMNTLAHMAGGLGASLLDENLARFNSYFDKNDTEHPSISDKFWLNAN